MHKSDHETSRETQSIGGCHTLLVLSPGALQGPQCGSREKSLASGRGKVKGTTLKYSRRFCS